MKFISLWMILFTIFMFLDGTAEETVQSPDGRLSLIFDVISYNEEAWQGDWLSYSVQFDGKTIVRFSPIALILTGQPEIGRSLQFKNVMFHEIDTDSEILLGKSKILHDHCHQIRISLQETGPINRHFTLIGRAYNDAVAFRLHAPFQTSLKEVTVAEERVDFRLLSGTAYMLPLRHFRTPYENNYKIVPTNEINHTQLIGLPLLIQLDRGPWLAITEANLDNYPGMYLNSRRTPRGTFYSKLSPIEEDASAAAQLNTPFDLPWRVMMVSDHPGKMIESNIILNLSEPSVIEDPTWIQPGKVAWDWWSDRVVEGRNFEGGMNTATMKYYIEFAAEAGLEYMLIDAGWYGKHNDPDADITTTISEIDLPEIMAHANSLDVDILLWLNWQCVRDQMEVAFPLYENWGVSGIKVDYMNGDNQQLVRFYEEVCQLAAKHHLVVNFHGAYKPTGLRRKYPNLLTREGVLGLEWSKWSEKCHPDHELIIPYTRMLAGPMDFTPGAFHNVNKEQFEPRITNPMAMGTRCRQLAMYVVYESPLQMLVDHPSAYFGQAGFDFIKIVPTVWDETRFIAGEVGDYIVLARRTGSTWFLGAMTDWTSRNLNIALDFLKKGPYLAEIYLDNLDDDSQPDELVAKVMEVTLTDSLELSLAPGGGWVAQFIPTWSVD